MTTIQASRPTVLEINLFAISPRNPQMPILRHPPDVISNARLIVDYIWGLQPPPDSDRNIPRELRERLMK